jgi:hypothetical protein
MPFERIESALSVCEKHIKTLAEEEISNKEVQTYLVSGIILLIVSEYEEHLEKLFVKRADMCGDTYVSNYVKCMLHQKFRSPDLSKINETLNRFGDEFKKSFFKEIENSAEHAAWDSLMKARHAIVHKKGQLNMTYHELGKAYPLTKNIIKRLENILAK